MSQGGHLYELAMKLTAQKVDVEFAAAWLVETAAGDPRSLEAAVKWAKGSLQAHLDDDAAMQTMVLLREATRRAESARLASDMSQASARLTSAWQSADSDRFRDGLFGDLERMRGTGGEARGPGEARGRRRRRR